MNGVDRFNIGTGTYAACADILRETDSSCGDAVFRASLYAITRMPAFLASRQHLP